MPEYFPSALFVHTEEGSTFVETLQHNSLGCAVTPVSYETLKQDPALFLKDAKHVIISGDMGFYKEMTRYSLEFHFSLGVIPLRDQKNLALSLSLPQDPESLIDLALRKEVVAVDIILCNEQILLFKASVGRIPIIDFPINTNPLRIIWNGLQKLCSLKLLPFTITTEGEKKAVIRTAACGCMIIQHHKRSLASRLIAHDSSRMDGLISLVVVAPISVFDYVKFVLSTLIRSEEDRTIPESIGYIKSPEITIETEQPMLVEIDGDSVTKTPLHCKVLPAAVRVNRGKGIAAVSANKRKAKEEINISALPAGKELIKAQNRKVPFFAYASEERFKDLFTTLREDARTSITFVILLVLSTILATTGLYLNSASVIIGAMVLAPLMAPIVSLAMGILRQEVPLIKRSIGTIAVGIVLTLMTAAVMTLFFTYKPVTGEMEARLSPTILDLIVAITAGIAGAYTKSYREILQSMAGVAIAVALVPPLAVAGIGIGRLDPEFFSQAFLLFSTNLVGITLAATFTFRLLGYSPVVKSKRGIGIVFFLFFLIFIPLYLSYNHIVETGKFEQSWQYERFFVHGKYLIIQKARLSEYGNKDILTMDILSRDLLTRKDLAELRRKIKYHFSDDLVIRANVIYIP